jgi:hypothetical protein
MPEIQCDACGNLGRLAERFGDRTGDGLPGSQFCVACVSEYPESLLKATCDPFDYALGLRNGMVFWFESASIHGEWVTLNPIPGEQASTGIPFPCPRGVEIRTAEILWCADAPGGS